MALIDNLVSYWKLDEASGNAIDAHDSNDGTVTGASYGATGIINDGYSFDGDGDRVNCGNPANLQLSAMSASFWVNTSANTRSIITKGKSRGNADERDWDVFGNGTNLIFVISNGSGYIVNISDTWPDLSSGLHHIVVTWDGTTDANGANIYVDNALFATGAATATNNSNSFNLYLGGLHATSAYEFLGTLDEVAVFNTDIGSSGVSELWNGGAGLAYPLSAGATVSLAGASSCVASTSASLTLLLKLAAAVAGQASVDASLTNNWLGISSTHLDSFSAGANLDDALDGTDIWTDSIHGTGWFILDLTSVYNISKIRGRSAGTGGDPTDVDVYVAINKSNFGSAVASNITSWVNTDNWQVENTTPKYGRYVKVDILDTESGISISFGENTPNSFKIIDVYGALVGSIVSLAAAVSCSAAVGGPISVNRKLAGAIACALTTSASMNSIVSLAGALSAQSAASASATVVAALTAAVTATAGTDAAISVLRKLAAAVTAQATVTGRLTGLETLIAGVIAATGGLTGNLGVGGRVSGIDEGVVNEFRYPVIPTNASPEMVRFLMELRTILEQQLLGDHYIGGDLHVDGDLHLGGSQV